MSALNPNAQKWVDALESGRFKQGKGVLHRTDGTWCCLGVACALAIEDGVPVATWASDDHVKYDGRGGSLPRTVQRWLGLTSDYGRYGGSNGSRWSLASSNDRGADFTEIAQLIRQHADDLFTDGAA